MNFPFPIRFTKSITGLVASMMDMGVLVLLVELVHVAPTSAIWVAQIAGSSIQFLGHRHGFCGVEKGPTRTAGLIFCRTKELI